MFTTENLEKAGENDPIWEFLGRNHLRELVFDLLLDQAMTLDMPAEGFTDDALRGYMGRIDFIRRMRESLPHSPEDLARASEPMIEPESVQ